LIVIKKKVVKIYVVGSFKKSDLLSTKKSLQQYFIGAN